MRKNKFILDGNKYSDEDLKFFRSVAKKLKKLDKSKQKIVMDTFKKYHMNIKNMDDVI